MKVAVLAESPSDQQFVYMLVNAVAGGRLELADIPVEARGWPQLVESALPATIEAVHYGFPEVAALIVVADSDLTEPHVPEHDPAATSGSCRWCRVRRTADQTLKQLKPNAARSVPPRVVVGTAEPCIENWLLCGTGGGHRESNWRARLRADRSDADNHRKSLKRAKYGTDKPGRAHFESDGMENARRVAAQIDELEQAFPTGFGLMAREIRDLAGG